MLLETLGYEKTADTCSYNQSGSRALAVVDRVFAPAPAMIIWKSDLLA